MKGEEKALRHIAAMLARQDPLLLRIRARDGPFYHSSKARPSNEGRGFSENEEDDNANAASSSENARGSDSRESGPRQDEAS